MATACLSRRYDKAQAYYFAMSSKKSSITNRDRAHPYYMESAIRIRCCKR